MTPLNTSVLLIYTGGTIGMIENTATGALENFNFEQLQRQDVYKRQLYGLYSIIAIFGYFKWKKLMSIQ